MPSRSEVESFLAHLKTKIGVFDVAFRGRDKNLDALIELEITPQQRVSYLQNLTAEDYCSGPNIDKDVPGRPNYYEFGIKINGKEVYIKLSIGLQGKMVDCISFHVAEYPMNFPLKTIHDEEDN